MAQIVLLHLNGSDGSTTIVDAIGTHTWAVAGSAVLDTAVTKFGSASGEIPSGSNIHSTTTFTATTEWTYDMWFYMTSVAGNHSICALQGPGSANITGARNSGNGTGNTYNVSFTGAGADLSVVGTKTTWSTGVMYHLEMTYDSVASMYYFYIDGVKDAEISSGTGMSGSGWTFYVGSNTLTTALIGNIDEVRYLDTCVHRAGTTFTPMSVEYPIDNMITPAAGSLVLNGELPDVQNSAARLMRPGTASLVLTGSLSVITDRYPAKGTLTLTGEAAVVTVGSTISPSTGVLQINATAPEVQRGATGAVTMRALTATGEAADSNAGYGAAVMRKFTANGYGVYTSAAQMRPLTATGTASGASYGAVVMKPLRAYTSNGTPRLRPLIAVGYGSAVIPEVYRTHVMNTVNNSVTEYLGFRFNSFAQIGGQYYGAGPDGFIRLDGNDDAGANINWKIRTGQTDDKQIGLKRLPEVVLGLRASGPIRVRVYPDDNQYYDYTLPNVKTNTIRQQRAKVGKGMEARYFAVELQGVSNSTLELDSLQMNMTPTTRRIG